MPPATQVDPGASRAGTRPTRRVLGVFVCRPLILVCRRVTTCDYVSGRLEKMRRVQHATAGFRARAPILHILLPWRDT